MPSLSSYTIPPSTPSLSTKTFHIAGILTTVFGLSEIPSDVSEVVCLWLLHPRLASQKDMAGLANVILHDYYQRLASSTTSTSTTSPKQKKIGLIAVTFDARNHGSRMIDRMANNAWNKGNDNHALDLFSIYSGTSQDVSTLIDFLPGYIFPTSQRSIRSHFTMGVSLGGHATWLSLIHEPRIKAGVIVIGMPDYVTLMSDRARLSKLSTWRQSQFIGSHHFPTTLLETVQQRDPSTVLTGLTDVTNQKIDYIKAENKKHENGASRYPLPLLPSSSSSISTQDKETKDRIRATLDNHLHGKRILCLSGADDKLVPYKLFEPFMTWFKNTLVEEKDVLGTTYFEDLIFENTGHQITEAMMKEALRFIYESVLALERDQDAESKDVKSNL